MKEKIRVMIYVAVTTAKLLLRYFFGYGKQPVYIAGKISGLDYDEVVIKFSKAENELAFYGYLPVNPVRLCPKEVDWTRAMRICMFCLSLCEMIKLLPDWHDSKGAMAEHWHAMGLNIGKKI